MHVAYADIIHGAAIFAGGPYHCAMGSMGTALSTCMTALPGPNVQQYITATDNNARQKLIADTKLMNNASIYMFSGTGDTTVKPAVMNALNQYYKHYVQPDKVKYVNNMAAAHTQPTDDPINTNPCWLSSSPYISNCQYDGAGDALKHMYGNLKPRNNGTLGGSIIQFDQNEFFGGMATARSMDTSGWAFVPKECAAGQRCKLHVSFHGCIQYYGKVGDAYVTRTGLNKWADTNNIIVLYPQTVASLVSPLNPNGCFDWWGYNGNPTRYDTNEGAQMQGIRAMISRVASGYTPLPAPDGLKTTNVSDHAVSLAWAPVQKAVAYNVFEGGTKKNDQPIPRPEFTVTGLYSGTKYTFTVNAIDDKGAMSAGSAPLTVTTTGPPPPLVPPANLHVQSTTATAVILAWDEVEQATGFNVFRNGTKVTAQPVTVETFTDTGLRAETVYTYTVTSVGTKGESAPTSAVPAKTAAAWNCTTATDNNYNHVMRGRAHQELGFVFATGSNEGMGLFNVGTYNTLSQTKSGYWQLGSCPPI